MCAAQLGLHHHLQVRSLMALMLAQPCCLCECCGALTHIVLPSVDISCTAPQLQHSCTSLVLL